LSVCSTIISCANKAGIDECESIFCAKKIITVRITDSEIAETKENWHKSVGVRLIHNKKISSCQSTILEPARLVDEALKSVQNLTKREFWKSLPSGAKTGSTLQKTNDQKIWKLDCSDAADIAQQMISSATHQKITRISGSLNIVCEKFELQNTSHLDKTEKATYIAGVINADSEHGNFPVSGIGQANSRTLTDFDAQSVGFEAAQMCINSINPQKCEPETTSIIFEPFAMGELLSFVFTPNFNLKTYSEKRSCFSEKIGKKIATSDFSLVDDPHTTNGLGSKVFDDEGVPTKVTPYINDGIFENTYSDSYDAFKEGTFSSGNACRPGSPLGRSSTPIPDAAPHNLTIKAADSTREDIIKDTKRGVLISRLWYTYAVNPIKGDFSCTARSGIWIIRDGQLVSPAKSVRIIHNLPMLLQNISAIANNQRTVLSWDAMPVTAPTIRCEKIHISPI
jgi:PmbA protein